MDSKQTVLFLKHTRLNLLDPIQPSVRQISLPQILQGIEVNRMPLKIDFVKRMPVRILAFVFHHKAYQRILHVQGGGTGIQPSRTSFKGFDSVRHKVMPYFFIIPIIPEGNIDVNWRRINLIR